MALPRPAAPLLRRLPADATPEQMARAYADALLFVLQTLPDRLEELTRTSDDMRAVVAVSDAVSQRAANAAAKLETSVQRVEASIAKLEADVERLHLAQGRSDAQLAALEHAQRSSTTEVTHKLEELEDEVHTGKHELPSDRVRQVVKSLTNEEELEQRRRRDEARAKFWADVLKGSTTAVGGAGFLEVAKFLVTHHW